MKTLKTYDEITTTIHSDFALVIAKSHTCSICSTIYETLERNIPYLDQVDTYSVFVDDIPKFQGEHLIFAVPTVLVFSNGKELLRESRYINYAKITRLIEMYTT